METPDKEDNLEMPGDFGDESGHSEGFYETRPENEEPESPENQEETKRDEDSTDTKLHDALVRSEVRKKSVVAFTVFGLMSVLFIAVFIWVIYSRQDDGIYHPLRKVLNLNEKVNKQFYSEKHLAPTYPLSKAEKNPRVNGDLGMDTGFRIADWQLEVVNIDKQDTMIFNMDSIKKLPKTEICFNFKCIEGWSQVTHWGGVRLIDFINHYRLATHSGKAIDPDHLDDLAHYAGFQTPDDQYYVGLDIASALHPQTLLCYEMNGKPLPYDQGAPLRLIVPVKYGIKSLKRIGLIYFSDQRPADYWFEQGYDYDASL